MHMTTGIIYIYYIHVGYYCDYRDKSLDYRDITFSNIAQHYFVEVSKIREIYNSRKKSALQYSRRYWQEKSLAS